MEVIGAFQTPICVTNIELPKINHLVWARNRGFWQTTPDLQKDKFLEKFSTEICNQVKDFSKRLGYKENDFFITQMWANKYEKYEGIHTHHHANSFFSGVVYFDDVGSTVLLRESNVKNILQMPVDTDTSFTNNHYEVPSFPGRMVIFPSYLVHYSTNNTDQPRISCSFNVLPKTLGDYDQYNFVDLN